MSPLTRIGRALAGLVGGTFLAFGLLVLGFVLIAQLFGSVRGDFGLGFGLVLAPAASLVFGVCMAVWMAIVPRPKHGDLFLFVSFAIGVFAYLIATAID